MKNYSSNSQEILDKKFESLFEISQSLLTFEQVDDIFKEIITIASQTVSIYSAILIESSKGATNLFEWFSCEVDPEQKNKIINRAHYYYNYLHRSNSSIDHVPTIPLKAEYFDVQSQVHHFISCPLLVNQNTIFGLLQIESANQFNERDVKWVNTLSNLFALALDRFRRVNSERQFFEKAARELELARLDAERANKAKSNFLANMSHEIRTPIGAILGFVNLLKDSGIQKEDMLHHLTVIDRNSNHLLRIIDDVLDLSKVEAGKINIEKSKFSLIELLADFTSLMALKAREKGVLFKFETRTRLPEFILSDSTRLRQILTNLVGNAIKFTEKGYVKLAVTYQSNKLIIQVLDSGRGITREQRMHIFKPFSQADSSTTRKYGGTGLGLALTGSLCEAMGGTCDLVKSEIDKGSVFEASLSIELPSENRYASIEEIQNSNNINLVKKIENTSLDGLEVLLVEDAPDNQILLKILISKTGAKVEIASNGIEGVKKALSRNYDIILMDIQMPEMDGYEAIHKLRNKNYKGPIAAVTAHTMKQEAELAKKAGFTHFLSKPICQTQLFSVLEDAYLKKVERGLNHGLET